MGGSLPSTPLICVRLPACLPSYSPFSTCQYRRAIGRNVLPDYSDGDLMTERDWELYRLSVVERMPDSALKIGTIAGIKHKLRQIDVHESAAADSPEQPHRNRLWFKLTEG